MKSNINVEPPPRILGAGLICLDIIMNKGETLYYTGGSCGNVISALSFLGWNSSIIMGQHDDIADDILQHNLTQLAVKRVFKLIYNSPTPRIIENLRKVEGNKAVSHEFLFTCPTCGKKMPPLNTPSVNDITTSAISYYDNDLLYIDRLSPGIKFLRTEFIKRNKWVFYEPNSSRNQEAFISNSLAAHIVKFSSDKVTSSLADKLKAQAQISSIRLIIQTLGANGLKFCYRMRNGKLSQWIKIQSQPISTLIDTAGAGDWCTAGVIFALISGTNQLRSWFTKDELIAALQYGQALAAISCSFIGAQGIFYSDETFNDAHLSFLNDIKLSARRRLNMYKLDYKSQYNLCRTCLLPL